MSSSSSNYTEQDEYSSEYEYDDYYEEQYALKHINFAYNKFKDITNPIIKYIIIFWYLLEVYSIQPQIIFSLVDSDDTGGILIMKDIKSIEIRNFFLAMIKESYDTSSEYYKLHDIRSNLINTSKMEMVLKGYLKTSLNSSFLPRLKEIISHYKTHKTIPKMAMDSVFKQLTVMIELDY